jgi:hypothetical protein
MRTFVSSNDGSSSSVGVELTDGFTVVVSGLETGVETGGVFCKIEEYEVIARQVPE